MAADKFQAWLDVANPRYSAALLPSGLAGPDEYAPAAAEFSTAAAQPRPAYAEPRTPHAVPRTPQAEPVHGLSTAAAMTAVNIAPDPA